MSPYPPKGTIYHILNDDVIETNKLKTICGHSGLTSYWFIHLGSKEQINCKNCIKQLELSRIIENI